MKVRKGFVSNSSTSSFIIDKSHLTEWQIQAIRDHGLNEVRSDDDQWRIEENSRQICGSTWMDNFDMQSFLKSLGIPMDQVTWSDSPNMTLEEVFQICDMMENEEKFLKRVHEQAEEFIKKSALVFEYCPDWLASKMDPAQFTEHPDEIRKFVNWLYRGFDKPDWKKE